VNHVVAERIEDISPMLDLLLHPEFDRLVAQQAQTR
jgi:hypothetical protein